MPITKKNHYIPCLFTAFWNFDYYSNQTTRESQKARKQIIYSLNIKSNKILTTTTENVFYEKGMGIADVTHESALDFAKRNNPLEFKNVLHAKKSEYDDLVIDFENFYTAMDNIYESPIKEIILKNNIENISDKTWIASFIIDLYIRNYQNQNSYLEEFKLKKKPKFELFWELKKTLSNRKCLEKMIIPLVASEWILYKETEFKFPICDIPLLINNKNILFAISPKMLLQIEYNKKVLPENICTIKNKSSDFIYREFIKRMILNANREIIFNDFRVLESLRNSKLIKDKN